MTLGIINFSPLLILIEIWSVYEIQEVVNFHGVKPDPVINRLFHVDAGTFVISRKFSFTKFPFCYGLVSFVQFYQLPSGILVGINVYRTIVFVDTRLWKTKHPRKRFQNFRPSCVLLTDRTEIHQLQP